MKRILANQENFLKASANFTQFAKKTISKCSSVSSPGINGKKNNISCRCPFKHLFADSHPRESETLLGLGIHT
jgi:hypothetical protein